MSIRGGETLEAYRTTTIPVHESQAGVRDLLRKRGATGLQISESWLADRAVADVRFGVAAESGGFYAYRIRVAVPQASLERARASARKAKQRASDDALLWAQVERQIWRLVFWWLKAQFEAADAGLVSIEEAFLPWMELPDGKTTYERMVEVGGLASIAAGTVPQLTAGDG